MSRKWNSNKFLTVNFCCKLCALCGVSSNFTSSFKARVLISLSRNVESWLPNFFQGVSSACRKCSYKISSVSIEVVHIVTYGKIWRRKWWILFLLFSSYLCIKLGIILLGQFINYPRCTYCCSKFLFISLFIRGRHALNNVLHVALKHLNK